MKTLSEAALRVLSTARIEGQTVTLTQGQLARDLYLEVNKALEALGGKWSKKLRAHVFDKTPLEISVAFDNVFSFGAFTDTKKELGQFFTPAPIAAALVKLANIKPGQHVLEPSAGEGAIIEALLALPGQVRVFAFDIDPVNVSKLRRFETGSVAVAARDFLTMKPRSQGEFERIVMNPPFAQQADIDHVLHAFKFLLPGGRLVSVMSAGVVFRENKKTKEFRQFVRKNTPRTLNVPAPPFLSKVSPDGFLFLPEHSFAEMGTDVSTVVVVLEKQ